MGSVIIRNGKAYVPTFALIKDGPFLIVEPVYEVNPTVEELTEALERVLSTDPAVIPEPTREEMKTRPDPMLKATGARSWKALAQDSLAYGIDWTGRRLWLALPELDKQGRFAADGAKMELPTNTSMRDLAATILEDAQARLRSASSP
jgi:hypothetical protein